MISTGYDVYWRASSPYLPNNSSKAGLLDETRTFLLTYAQLRDLTETRRHLVDGGLPQRSRATRVTIVRTIQERLTRWCPPTWVLDELVTFARDSYSPSLPAALLLHVVRQDVLLYDFVQNDLVPRWARGDHALIRADVQRFLDLALPEHPEIDEWSHATREKLAGNVLSILRDYGLLRGKEQKQIVEPLVPDAVAGHLIRLLRAEGIPEEQLADHPDWRIWLWERQRAQQAIGEQTVREALI
jgi:bacteriophage exclusion system BrxA-like protein